MIDIEGIDIRLDKLRGYASYLKNYQKKGLDELKNDYTLQGAVLHYLQLSIECVTDIGELIISGLNYRRPHDAREVIDILGENNVITKELAQKIAPAVGFRNLLVHEYVRLDLSQVHRHLKEDLEDFNSFAKSISAFIKDNL